MHAGNGKRAHFECFFDGDFMEFIPVKKSLLFYILALAVLAFGLPAGLDGQEIIRRTGSMLEVQGILQGSPGDTVACVRHAPNQSIPVGNAVIHHIGKETTSIWIIHERTGFVISAGDVVEGTPVAIQGAKQDPRPETAGPEDAGRNKERTVPTYTLREPRSRIRAGMSLGAAAGFMIPETRELYDGLGPYFYPELQLLFDLGGMRFGVTLGFIDRSFSRLEGKEVWDPLQGMSIVYEEVHDRRHALPILIDIALLPLRFTRQGAVLHPFFGIAPGIYLGLGEDESAIACAFKAGMEAYFGNWAVIDVEARYTYVPDRFGFFNVLAGLRLRIPFSW